MDILGLDLYSILVGHFNRQDPASMRTALPELVRDPLNTGYYSLDPSTRGPIEPDFTAVTSALREVAGKTADTPDVDVAVLHSVYHKTYRTRMAEASDVKNALADLGLKATVIYDYEVRERPRLLSSFKAIVVPRLSLEYLSLRYFNAAGADPSGEFGEAHNPETHLAVTIFRHLRQGIVWAGKPRREAFALPPSLKSYRIIARGMFAHTKKHLRCSLCSRVL